MQIPEHILEKYNKPVPRYTSYPPANHFNSEFGADSYISSIEQSNTQTPKNISLYIHIPFCKKMCYYCGCNSIPIATEKIVNQYIDAVKREIEMIAKRIDKTRLVTQLHFGGGTPNSIPAHHMEGINNLLLQKFNFASNAEIAIECHPTYLDEEYIDQLKKAGFKRFSLGIQDFNPIVVQCINRDEPPIPLEQLFSLIKKDSRDTKINLDFISGLPGQTRESFAKTMEKAISLKPDRITIFPYAHVPWVNRKQVKLEKLGLPSSELRSQINEQAESMLLSAGYLKIGMDHFALPNDELAKALLSKTLHRNFQGYCTRQTTGQVYAFGVSGISQLAKSYAQNTKSIVEYIATINKDAPAITRGYKLSDNQVVIREVIAELMCNNQLLWDDIAFRLKISINELKKICDYSPVQLQDLSDDGLINYTDDKITVTKLGKHFIRNIASVFDPIYSNANTKYSKPI